MITFVSIKDKTVGSISPDVLTSDILPLPYNKVTCKTFNRSKK